MKLKYLIFKIVGILGLIVTPVVCIGYYDEHLNELNSRYMDVEWLYGYEGLLILFLLITIAGFARPIARLKALIDFHTDFDDDQELDGYPKLYKFAIVKKVMLGVSVGGSVLLAILAGKFSAIDNILIYLIVGLFSINILLALINIIICLCMRINPIYFDIGVIFAIVGVGLFFFMEDKGISFLIVSMATAPIFAIALLYLAFAAEEHISADEVFDWFLDDEYNDYYKKLCDREKAQKADDELSEHKKAKQEKITEKQTAKAEKKQCKKKENQNESSSKKVAEEAAVEDEEIEEDFIEDEEEFEDEEEKFIREYEANENKE